TLHLVSTRAAYPSAYWNIAERLDQRHIEVFVFPLHADGLPAVERPCAVEGHGGERLVRFMRTDDDDMGIPIGRIDVEDVMIEELFGGYAGGNRRAADTTAAAELRTGHERVDGERVVFVLASDHERPAYGEECRLPCRQFCRRILRRRCGVVDER